MGTRANRKIVPEGPIIEVVLAASSFSCICGNLVLLISMALKELLTPVLNFKGKVVVWKIGGRAGVKYGVGL